MSNKNLKLKDEHKILRLRSDNKDKIINVIELESKIGSLYNQRIIDAQKEFLNKIRSTAPKEIKTSLTTPLNLPQDWLSYLTDFFQRSVLFWDTIRQRGNNFLEQERTGKPPVLVYNYETIVDGREFKKPVNFALLRIIPPDGIKIDGTKRPFMIVDPRAGQGPGIGGFKKDSEVGVIFNAGHPVYFVRFFPEPMPGQTMLDVLRAQTEFVRVVRDMHPNSPKPVIYGNCQGGWASMMVAASRPDLAGPVVISGAPLSYWSGNWNGGAGENPMRYSGGLLGGVWMSMLAGDLGNGKYDGAYLVQNFENLNLANTFWDKYYYVFENVDTEPPRFLEFEKWWHDFILLNEEEMHWMVDNLFIGNKLARGEVRSGANTFFNLKSIRSPIITFSSKGDNITPPQQALNWIADVYDSTQEIKANGQVIVGLVEEEVGHLGIFVSGRVAKKEHTEIVEVLEYIESLLPGLYLMRIQEVNGEGKVKYEVMLEEQSLEDLRRINKFQRKDEKAFEVVESVSQMNERAYALFARPFIRLMANENLAILGQMFNPLRWQCWAFSDLNPMMWPLPRMAEAIKSDRKPSAADNPYLTIQNMGSKAISAWLNLMRDQRDASSAFLFFQIYGTLAELGATETKLEEGLETKVDPRELPVVKESLSVIGKGGYPEALARIGALVVRMARGEKIQLQKLKLPYEFVRSDKVLSKMSEDEIRRIINEQVIIVEFEPESALQTLPMLLPKQADRERVLELLEGAESAFGLVESEVAAIKEILDILSSRRRRAS